ncbi:hypothetical protein ATY27_11240 [Rheinheimera sp. F8]|nr:hypothetical protein ATY27_05705 [Rheinheimera sp. F8]ALZ76274.1 hypothetical protein ATY27_11240 [Rheinheimera sp. F8]
MSQRCSLAFGLIIMGIFADAQAASATLQLQLLPQTCVITEQQPQCNIQLKVKVSGGAIPQQLCLFHGTVRHSCQRHSPQQSSWFEVSIHTDKNQHIYLKGQQGELLASAELMLVQYQSVHKRHKRGYLWNML